MPEEVGARGQARAEGDVQGPESEREGEHSGDGEERQAGATPGRAERTCLGHQQAGRDTNQGQDGGRVGDGAIAQPVDGLARERVEGRFQPGSEAGKAQGRQDRRNEGEPKEPSKGEEEIGVDEEGRWG